MSHSPSVTSALGRGAGKAPLAERLRALLLQPSKPAPSPRGRRPPRPPSAPELAVRVRVADDKERLIGLLGAPFAAAIGFLVIGALLANDPPALLATGRPDKLHVAGSLYHELLGVLLLLAVLMLAMAMLRNRLFLGIVMALYGLAVFNLHYWGFGIPFLLAGSWLLVRAYRLQRDLRSSAATGHRRPG